MSSLSSAAQGSSDQLSAYLQDITEALAASDTAQKVIEIVLTPAVRALGATAGIVLLVDSTDQQMKIAGSQGYEDGAPTLWQEGKVADHVLIADILRMKEARYFEDAGELKAAYPELESRTGPLAVVANATLPMFLDDRPLGVIVLDFKEPHDFTPAERRFLTILSGQCAVALGRAEATRDLEARVEERTRQLKEEQAAQTAFVAFTEAVGSETDLPTLVRQAITVLQGRFPVASIGYYEEEGPFWRARVWSDDLSPELVAMMTAGFSVETPLFAEVIRTRQPVFINAWDAQRERVPSSEEYGTTAIYPLVINGELQRLLGIGLRHTRTWSEADKALLRSVGRGLNLALERTETARQVMLQNAELQVRTRALEAFAELTRDLALTIDPLLLIRRAQEVVMSMLADGAALYMVPEGELWFCQVQHGNLHSPDLQAVIDAGLPGTANLLTPWTTGQPHFQDVFDRASAHLPPLVGHVSASVTMPLRVEGQMTGILSFVLFQQRHWSSVDRAMLDTTVQTLELALDRAAKARRLDEERTALEAFTRFTLAVGSETEMEPLVRHAITLLQEVRSSDVTYSEREGDLFKIKVWNPGFPADLLARSLEGYSLEQPSFARANRERRAIFEQPWDTRQQDVPQSAYVRAAAFQPFFQDGEMTGVLIMGSRTLSRWSERDKGIFQAVGQSLDLALDRARQTRELAARTRQLEDSTLELELANRELQAFSYSMSHDLRTPVRHMIGFLHLAQKELDGQPNERATRYLDVVGQAGERMNTLIDAMLDLSRAAQQTPRPQLVDLNGLMTRIQATLLPDLLTRNVQWEMADLPEVWGDQDALAQVMTQLTENAVKFTRGHDPAIIRVWAEDQGETWRVCVEDNGLGFDPRYRDRLFNMFQRLHSAQEASGTGVGLASVRRLILNHGGQVFAEGQVGEGATFGFTLPKSLSAQVRAASPLGTVIEKLARAEEQATTAEAQQRFLLTLSDALRPLGDPVEIQGVASQLLGEQLASDRASYVELDEAAGEFVGREWHRSGALGHVRRYPPSEGQMPGLMDGRTWVLRDMKQDQPLSDDQRAAYRDNDIRAAIVVPFLREGRLVATVVANQGQPRDWTPQEIALVEEAAQRTWAAVERARTGEALRESEVRRDLALETAELGTYVWHAREDRTEADARLLALFGRSEETQATFAYMLDQGLHPDDRAAYVDVISRAMDPAGDGRLKLDFRVVHPDKSVHWMASTGQALFAGQPRQAVRIIGTVADITERKQVEERQAFLLELSDALRAEQGADGLANRALGMLAEHLHLDRCYIGVYRLDDDWGDFTHQVGNDRVPPVPSGVRLSDFPDALRVSFDSTLVIDDVAQDNRLSEVDRQNLAGLGMGALVAAALRKGEHHPLWSIVAVSASPRQWTSGETALIEEVTERTWAATGRVHAENAVQASQEQFRAVANLVPELLWESEPDGETTWYNGRWLEYTGQTFEQAISWGWTGAIHPEDREDSTRRYGAAVTAGQALRQEHRIRRHDGEYRWFAVDTAPVTDEHGQIIRMYGAATDIHDLRTMNTGLEAQVENRTQRLADLNAELGNLIMRTAYNLEEPARRLSHLLEPEGSSDFQALWNQPAYDPVALSDEVKRLKGVAHDLRQLSILEEQPLIKEPLPLGELFTELSTMTPGSDVTWQIEALPIVRGDRALLRQALEVLMTFTLSETRGARYVTVSSRQIEGEVQITVQDNGTGLNGEEAATIFDLAMHTEDTVPVLEGGGLVQVRRILARHGGWAWAESQRSSGKVVLAFPKDEASELEALFRQDKPGM